MGIKLTKDTSNFYNDKYDFINRKIGDDLDRLGSLPLDLGNWILTIKMNILPRLLYLFQSLPVQIPDIQFRTGDKQI